MRFTHSKPSHYVAWLISILISASFCQAQNHTFYYNVTEINLSPDGVYNKTVLGFNNSWPLPNIHINEGDRITLHLFNGLPSSNTSLHFHGLLQNGSNQMDGPELVTQCPIAPGSTFIYDFVVEQHGTYWYHSHTGNQYLDGLRGALIVHDPNEPFEYDEDVVLTISDWYHSSHQELMKQFLNRYNPTGAEPVPQNSLFNDTRNVLWEVKDNSTYLLRIANIGGFVSQYLFIEEHEMTVVEIDGVYVEPYTADMLYVTVGQRYTVLIKTKTQPERNFCFMQIFDDEMLDVIPPDLALNSTSWLVYDKSKPLPDQYLVDGLTVIDDFKLANLAKTELLSDYDYRVVLDVDMVNLGDGINYAFFNNLTYTPPKVPTLATVFSAPDDLLFNRVIYGSNTHSFILLRNEVVEIVLNNHDDGKHPFHLHGHNFQIVQKSDADADDYDEKNHAPFPDYPAIRDTVSVEGNGHLVLRFRASNPGVWFFHCHVDWHLEQGLAVTFIEDPKSIKENQHLSSNYKEVCAAVGVSYEGNAAGNLDFTDLKGENVQAKALPLGFTTKGYVAMALCIAAALYGLYTIFQFGSDSQFVSDDQVIATLEKILSAYEVRTHEQEQLLTSPSDEVVH